MNQNVINKPSENYYQHRRISVSESISKGAHRILDVGCGAGNFGAYLLQSGHAKDVVGIELIQAAADEASTKLNQVYCADLNRSRVADLLQTPTECMPFDYIVCADVLEHLVDPWQVLRDLSCYLAPGGKIIASIPNVRHWTVWLPLIVKGRWDYLDEGIMDRTHLRFFTKATILDLFASAGLDVVELRPLIGGKWRLVDKYSLQLLREMVAIQWVCVGVRKDGNV